MLNSMWPKEKDAHPEKLWNFVAMFSELEIENHAEGCDLDEMGMHRVFERMDKHQTMQEMRAHFRKVGVESFKRTSMIHFLLFNYGYDWVELVNAPHLGNAEGIEKAKQIVEEVAFADAQCTAEAAKEEEAENEEKHTALQQKAETGSLVAKNAALKELAQLDKEDHLDTQIAWSLLFVLIGLFETISKTETSFRKTSFVKISSFDKPHLLRYFMKSIFHVIGFVFES